MLKFTAELSGLRSAFKKLSIAMSREETRYYFMSVLFEKRGDEIYFVSTDGHKAVVINVLNNIDISLTEQSKIDLAAAKDFAYIIPRYVVDEFLQGVKHNYSMVEISIIDSAENKTISFCYGKNDSIRTYKLMDATYPEWRKVIPIDTQAYTSFNAKYLKQICSVLSLGKGVGVAFESSKGENANNAPSVVTDNTGVKFVIMPMRL